MWCILLIGSGLLVWAWKHVIAENQGFVADYMMDGVDTTIQTILTATLALATFAFYSIWGCVFWW